MQGDAIEFEWTKCLDGYRVAPAEPLKEVPREQWHRRAAPWRSDVAPIPPLWGPATGREIERIEPCSARYESYRPQSFGGVFETFAKAEASAEGMRRFADGYGLLTKADHSVQKMLEHHRALKVALMLQRSGDPAHLVKEFNHYLLGDSSVALRLVEGRIRQVIVPATLISFMWLEFAQYAAGCTKLEACSHCGKLFQSGTGTGRRRVAQGRPRYCSNRCKTASFRARMVSA